MKFLNVETDEQKLIVRALNLLAEDYRTISESLISPILRREFEADANTLCYLADRVSSLQEKLVGDDLNARVRILLAGGQKIEAIKLVRANTTLGLKEAKDYVDAL